ncbi:MAG: HNH endonuclease [Thermomicrobiales bacterium]
MNRSACQPGLRDWAETPIEAVFALWLLLLVLAAPWHRGLAPVLAFLAVGGGISLLIFQRGIAPVISRFLFRHGRHRRCLDPFHRRLPSIAARRDPAWAAIAQVPRMELDDYYRSEPWRQRRQLKLAEANHACQWCGATSRLQVHHKTYARSGRERRGDLLVLCCACHGRHHRKNLCGFSRYGAW